MNRIRILALCIAILLGIWVPMQAQASNVNLLTFDMCVDGVSVYSCDKSGTLDVDDAIYLLQHVMMPTLFPL